MGCIFFNVFTDAVGRLKHVEGALKGLEEMRSESPPDLISYNTVLTACGRCGKAQEAIDLIQVLFRIITTANPFPARLFIFHATL